MRKVLLAVLTGVMLLNLSITTVHASSLDDVVNGSVKESTESSSDNSTESNTNTENNTTNQTDAVPNATTTESDSYYVSADEYIASTRDAANLASVDVRGADKVNDGVKKVAAFIVRILSYALTAFLVVRVLIDLVYIALPFTRSILSNGYAGNPSAGGSGNMMQQPGMGGMGTGMGAGMSGMGMNGMGGMGMGGMRGGYGMNRMGMGGMTQGQVGASPAMGRTQWVSSAALNAVEAEHMPSSDGKPQSALKIYAKDMLIVLILTPILLTLAITGVLTNLGFLIGDVIAKGITSIGGML